MTSSAPLLIEKALSGKALGEKERVKWQGLSSSSSALAIAEIASDRTEPLLVVTPDTASANRLYDEVVFFLGNASNVYPFTDWETLPYDHFSPHEDIISTRLETLYRVENTPNIVVIISITSLMHKLAPKQYLSKYSLMIRNGDIINPHELRSKLEQSGYHCVETVYEHGEFAIRGALMDIYPMGSKMPIRVDFFDNEVDTLRTFDPETQRTEEKISELRLLPAKEYPLDKTGISHFRNQWHDRFDVDHKQCSIYNDISQGYAAAGIEYYLPLFFDECASFFDYLPDKTTTIILPEVEKKGQQFWQEIYQRYENYSSDRLRPLLKPTEIFITVEQVFHKIKQSTRILLDTETNASSPITPLPVIAIDHKRTNPFEALQLLFSEKKQHVLFSVESAGRREILLDLFKPLKIKPTVFDGWHDFVYASKDSKTPIVGITESAVDRGFSIDGRLTFITEGELFGQQIQQRRRRKSNSDNQDYIVKNLTELKIDSPVVHLDHGVGRYKGLQSIDVDGQANEFLMLEYADDTKLYVPVTHLHLISRYSGGDAASAPLHRLGSDSWQKAKDKAAKELRDVAAELLEIYAKREAKKGHSFTIDNTEYERFCASFPFEETPDQKTAIEAVKADMLTAKPMDRLVCGDVGFGKTEVAMRAAFIATSSNKQVAVLVPTTLLAEQHYSNFKDRFADWPIHIEVLSRFRQTKDTEQVIKRIDSGHVDIIIGTHKLLQASINFKDLGLLIIDEEHRFGVKQKEKVKALRSEVDILTLTATPIPRTLNLSMNGIRDLSIIATAPAKRLSVKTFVRQTDDSLIKEAIMREMLRGGQVYYLHNEVKSIEKSAKTLSELIPEARIGIAHGQLRERDLEQVMGDFYHHRINVLICSTIIETGIDIPNANTIIIERADKFGLAQLHQLRGRVGRSHHQAYAYLLTPSPKTMTKDAQKRLEAIAATQDLGAGFTLATHDLEIRGAGEFLGDEQSGQMHTIGFSLYMEMLNQTVKALKEGKPSDPVMLLSTNTDINLRIPALIPDDYLPDVHTRLTLYKRLSAANNQRELDDLQVEMIDRFGLLPSEAKHLFAVTEIKMAAEALGIIKVEATASQLQIDFSSQPKVDPLAIVKLVQNNPEIYQLKGASRLKMTSNMKTAESRITETLALFEKLN